MDHQIQYHAYFGATRVKLCQAVHFNKHGVQVQVLYGKIGRVKPFHMAYLHFHIGFTHHVHQVPCLTNGIAQRLLHKYMFALAYRFHAYFKMPVGGHHHVNNVTGIHQFVLVHITHQSILGRNGFGIVVIGVKKTNQFYPFNFFPVIQMELS